MKRRLGPVQIAGRLGMPASTVHAVLPRCRVNRLSHIDRRTGEPVRRYEHDHAGAMLHVDVEKLGQILDGGGWRYVGRVQGDRNREATARRTGTRNHRWEPRVGTTSLGSTARACSLGRDVGTAIRGWSRSGLGQAGSAAGGMPT